MSVTDIEQQHYTQLIGGTIMGLEFEKDADPSIELEYPVYEIHMPDDRLFYFSVEKDTEGNGPGYLNIWEEEG